MRRVENSRNKHWWRSFLAFLLSTGISSLFPGPPMHLIRMELLYQVILQWKPFYPLTRRGSFKNYLNQTPSPLNTPLPSCLIAIHGQEYPLPREPVMFSRPKMFGKIKKPKFYIICCLSTALLAICLKCQINCQVSCQNYSGVVPLHALSQNFQQNVIS